ncbi:MAG: hypothetical protein C0425_06185 [Chlorobiaceae bacterium]|nr:hypothetical protein [Chlorobiaceae bacterium]MBA4309908.1 hypothetical protein [Chlorobiaceae bacterium]
MFGKASIILILGFSAIFLLYTQRFTGFSDTSVENYVDYYSESMAASMALTGANMAANQIFLDQSWTEGFNNIAFNNGRINVTVNTLNIVQREVVSIGTFNSVDREVRILLQPSNFAKFAYYTSIMPGNLWFVTGDTIWGPMHIQGNLNVFGTPVFNGRVTIRNQLRRFNAASNPRFFGGFETGVSIPMPGNVDALIAASNSGGRNFRNTDLFITFNTDGTVTWRAGTSGNFVTEPLSTFAPNGSIVTERGNVHVSGTLNGRVTLAATHSSGTGHGNVFLVDDLVYRQNPLTGPSQDMLGLVATNNIIIRNVPANRGDVNIHGSLLSLGGGLMAEDHGSIGRQGAINLVGGIIERQAQPTGVFDPGTGQITSGYNSRFKYDERFMLTSPPFFPVTGSLEIVSWYE